MNKEAPFSIFIPFDIQKTERGKAVTTLFQLNFQKIPNNNWQIVISVSKSVAKTTYLIFCMYVIDIFFQAHGKICRISPLLATQH